MTQIAIANTVRRWRFEVNTHVLSTHKAVGVTPVDSMTDTVYTCRYHIEDGIDTYL